MTALVISNYLLPPVNHQQAEPMSYYNHNDRLKLANQRPNINYIISQQNVWNVEITNLTANNYTHLDINILVSTQFMDLKPWEFICIVLFYLHPKFWGNLKYSQKVG